MSSSDEELQADRLYEDSDAQPELDPVADEEEFCETKSRTFLCETKSLSSSTIRYWIRAQDTNQLLQWREVPELLQFDRAFKDLLQETVVSIKFKFALSA